MIKTLVQPVKAVQVPAQRRQTLCQTTSFRYSLDDGWNLGPVETDLCIKELRAAPVFCHLEVVLADAGSRRQQLVDFFGQLHMSPRVTALLATRINPRVTSIVARPCAGDQFWTLIPEFPAYG